uniref:ATP synthase F0 subunit 8 n=1 Tax=Amegilla calceifera TaxID=597987 RepID=A0A7U0M7S8_9HYME|nr:ATP synthase F0 subunit 8 [Amegilla calceifera]QQX28002.1 ATP synthase F0 subunit 8 [Amegilla calceifera]
MPQMSPMLWTLISLFNFISMFTILLYINSLMIDYKLELNLDIKNNNNNLKWNWLW